jgi:hypothetical protein
MLAAVALIDLLWLIADGWTVHPDGLIPRATIGLIFCAPLIVRRYRHDARIAGFAEAIAFTLICATAGEILSYLAVSASRDLVDPVLASADHMLGFDWGSYYLWSHAHPAFLRVINAAYESMGWQTWIVLTYLCFTQRAARLSEFLELSASLLVVTIAISWFVPAAGASKFYAAQYHADVSSMAHFELLRSGTMKTIDIRMIQGLVSIPSYHTIMGLLLCWSMRGLWLLPFFLILNATMLLATPVIGGHYFVDLIAGAALTVTGIQVRCFLLNRPKPLLPPAALHGPAADTIQ